LVALVIVAVGMSALMGALSSSARTVTYMQDKTFSEWVALNQVATVRIACRGVRSPPPATPTVTSTSPGEAGTGGRRCSTRFRGSGESM